jgi:hypothetical protein
MQKWKRPVLKGLNSGASLTPCGNENNSIPIPSEVAKCAISNSSHLHENVNAHLTTFLFDCGWFHNAPAITSDRI